MLLPWFQAPMHTDPEQLAEKPDAISQFGLCNQCQTMNLLDIKHSSEDFVLEINKNQLKPIKEAEIVDFILLRNTNKFKGSLP